MTARLIGAVVILLVTAAAHAETFGFVDVQRVNAEATEPRRLLAPLQQEQPGLQKEIEAAQAAEAKPELRAAAQQHLDAFNERLRAVNSTLESHRATILAKLKAEHHLAEILPIVPLTPSKTDLTDEVIRRWDALDAKGMADELARTKAENERLRAAARPEPPKK